MLHTGNGNRGEWEFEYTAHVLADAAERQRDFRKSRVTFWTEAQEKVMAEVRESGIHVSESAAAGTNYQNSGVGPQVMVRGDLQKKLTECHGKIQAHSQAAAEYDGWSQVLRANPESRLKLTHSDWLYFFGKV